MSDKGLSPEELKAEMAIALPDKEVVSILDLNVDVDVFIDAASPIDLAAAAQLNVAAPIDAAAGANVAAFSSPADASVDQGAMVTQILDANATAIGTQVSEIDQSDEADGDTTAPDDGGTGTAELGLFEGPLLNVDVNVDLDADLAAPIAGAVAANANVAAPISASVAANVITFDSSATAVSEQDAIIRQVLTGDTYAESDQNSSIAQGTTQPDAGATVLGSTSRLGELGGTGTDSGDSTSTATGTTSSTGDSASTSTDDSASTGTTSSSGDTGGDSGGDSGGSGGDSSGSGS